MKSAVRIGLTGLLVIFTAVTGFAVTPNVPHVINYQGRLTDGVGNPISDGPHGARFILWRDSTSTNPGDIVWDSGPLTVTTDKGVFSIRLGEPPQPTLDPVNMQDTIRFLGITVGADPEITPRTRLTSVPYAYIAQHANTALSAGTAYALDPTVAPAAGTVTFYPTSSNSSSFTAIGQFSVLAPGPGFLTINLSGFAYIDADATSTTSLTTYFGLSLCDAPNTICPNTTVYIYVTDPDNSSTDNTTPAYSFNMTVPVFFAGTYTFYLNAWTGSAGWRVYGWGPATASAIFSPNTLTMTSPAPPQNLEGQNTPLRQQQERR